MIPQSPFCLRGRPRRAMRRDAAMLDSFPCLLTPASKSRKQILTVQLSGSRGIHTLKSWIDDSDVKLYIFASVLCICMFIYINICMYMHICRITINLVMDMWWMEGLLNPAVLDMSILCWGLSSFESSTGGKRGVMLVVTQKAELEWEVKATKPFNKLGWNGFKYCWYVGP